MATNGPPLSTGTKVALGLGGIVAFLGRRVIIAYYGRTVQFLTDPYIKYVGGVMLATILGLLLNFAFMMTGARGLQTILAILLPFVALFYSFMPAIGPPLVVVTGGPKNLFKMMALVIWWLEFYILVTMVAPLHMYPALFWLLHIPIIGALALLGTGHVPVDSEKVYTRCFYATIWLLVIVVLVVFVRREHLQVDWAMWKASKTSQAQADIDVQSIKNADDSMAEWVKKNVKPGPRGEQLIIVKDAETGKLKAVPAQPYIDQEQARVDAVIKSIRGRKSGTSLTPDGNLPGWVPAWAREWGPVQWMAGSALGLVVMHVLLWSPFLALLAWLGFKVGTKDDDTKVVAKKVVSSDGVSVTTLVVLALLLAGGYYWYQSANDPTKVHAPIIPTPTITYGDDTSTRDASKWKVQFTDLLGNFPQAPHSGKFEGYLTRGSYATSGIDMVISFGAGQNYDLKLFDGACVPGKGYVPRKCSGNWDAGYGRAGVFDAEWSPQGDNLRVKLYDTPHLWEVQKKKLSHHAELLIVLK